MNLEAYIEAVLFYRSEPVKKAELCTLFEVPRETLDLSLAKLHEILLGRGLRLTETDTEVQLVTAPEMQELIDTLRKEELSAGIGKAGAETLAIILYRGPIARTDIDRVRGVNSTFILRNLLVRGLIERRSHPSDSRSFTYAVTPALLNHLGVARREDLPDFGDIMNALDLFEKRERELEAEPTHPFQNS